MIKQFRYVINNEPCAWQNCSDVSVEKMELTKARLTKFYGENWTIEYREVENEKRI